MVVAAGFGGGHLVGEMQLKYFKFILMTTPAPVLFFDYIFESVALLLF